MKIRSARKKDVPAIIKIEIEEDKRNYYLKKEDLIEDIKDKRNVVLIIAEENNEILGFVVGDISPVKRTEGFVHSIMIKRRYRNKGAGTLLVREICSRLFKKGVRKIYAMVEKETLPFYKNCRFKLTHKWLEMTFDK